MRRGVRQRRDAVKRADARAGSRAGRSRASDRRGFGHRSPTRRRLGLAALVVLVAGAGATTLTVSTFAASSGPLTWSAPQLVDNQYPHFTNLGLQSLSCPSSTLCVATNPTELVTSTNPRGAPASGWSALPTAQLTPPGTSLTGVGCAPSVCAAAGTNAAAAGGPGVVLTSSNPAGGAGAWVTTGFPDTGLVTPSCAQGTGATVCATAGTSATSSTTQELYVWGGSGAWTRVPVTSPTGAQVTPVAAVSCPTTTLCVAAGSGQSGGQSTYDFSSITPTAATSWSMSSFIPLRNVTSLSCTPIFCLAFDGDYPGDDGNNRIAITNNPGAGANTAWAGSSPSTLSGIVPTSSISCYPDSAAKPPVLCIAGTTGAAATPFDPAAAVVSTTAGLGANSTWSTGSLTSYTGLPAAFSCASATLCFAATNSGAVESSINAGLGAKAAWSAPVGAVPGQNPLTTLACPSTSLCVAADEAGNAVTSGNPAAGGSSWTPSGSVDPDPNVLFALACVPASTTCVAGDAAGNLLTTTNPAGGAAAWSAPTAAGAGAITGLACPSSTLCVGTDGGGSVLTSTNPAGGPATFTTSSMIDDNGGLAHVACAPASTLCVASDVSGDLATSASAGGGATAWKLAAVDGVPILGVSCPSAMLCVAVDEHGDVLSSANPNGGVAAWSAPVNVDAINGTGVPLSAISCPSIAFCVATDAAGRAVTSTAPRGGAASWTAPAAIGATGLDALDCPSTVLCVSGNALGDVLTGAVAATTTTTTTTATTTTTTGTAAGGALGSSTLTAPSPSSPLPTGGGQIGATTTTATVGNERGGVLGANTTTPLPPPVLGKAVNVTPVSGTVLIKLPPGAVLSRAHGAREPLASASATKGTGFVPLTQARQIPVNSILDTTGGTVAITAASTTPGTDYSGDFTAGIFKLLQGRSQKGLTTLDLMDTRPRNRVCASTGKGVKASAAARKVSSQVLGLLKSTDHGKFSTRGDYSAATVRGTQYSVENTCAGTLTTVTRGVVVVDYFRRHKNLVLRAGQSFLARASGGPSAVVTIGKGRSHK